MGNAQAHPSNPRFDSACRSFTKKELEDLQALFLSLAAQSQSADQYISPSVFQGIYEKGCRDEIEEFIYQLLDINGDDILGRSDLEAVLASMYSALFSPINTEPGFSSSPDIMQIFLDAAKFSKKVEGCNENSMSFEDFKNWCSLLPAVRKFLGSLLIPSDPGSQVPHLLYSEDLSQDLLILRKEYAWHIGGALSQDDIQEWKLLYHSAVNGLSFNTFLSNISTGECSTVLLIKDKEGYIYGGYASQPWERHSDFYGDMKSFIFQLYPQASIFRPTGSNRNLQWFAVNFSSESIPNGIGFGGQANHFGLFLSASFDEGHTLHCSTFDSPPLSKGNRIYPETIECWAVMGKGVQNERIAVSGTVLERFKEDRQMLNMVGLANSSE